MKVDELIETRRADWCFDGDVAKSFVAHAERSIPNYHEGHDLVSELSDFFVHGNSVCYEIGVSTGQLIRKLSARHEIKPDVRWVGLDVSAEMLREARTHCKGIANIELCQEDFLEHDAAKSDLIICYYTAQFVSPRVRQLLFDKIYERLNWGGGFILFEKVRGPDARFQDMASLVYQNFKREQGFTPDEIMNKAESLKGVLEPFSTQGNLDLMKRAGFVDVMSIMKWVCFEGFLAIK